MVKLFSRPPLVLFGRLQLLQIVRETAEEERGPNDIV